MIASSAILHLARNGDVSLTTRGAISFACVVILLTIILVGVWTFRS